MSFKNFCFVLLVAIVLEIVFFNYTNIKLMLNQNIEKNISIMQEDIEYYNWERRGNLLVSKTDPILIIPNVNSKIKAIKLDMQLNKPIPYIVVFYTDKENEKFGENTMIIYNKNIQGNMLLPLDAEVNDLRIDLGDDEGVILSELKIIINPVTLNFSIYRVIAMLLIYLLSVLLFKLQRNPDYKLDK